MPAESARFVGHAGHAHLGDQARHTRRFDVALLATTRGERMRDGVVERPQVDCARGHAADAALHAALAQRGRELAQDDAVVELVLRELPKMASQRDAREDARWRWRMLSERTRDQSYQLAALSQTGGFTGDPEIDGVIKNSLFFWRAAGKKIDSLKEGEKVRVTLRLLL